MKTKSLTAMLMAMALSFNFAACSDEDENGGGGSASGDASKRLVRIDEEIDTNAWFRYYTFDYDSEGKATEAIEYTEYEGDDNNTWEHHYTAEYAEGQAVITCAFSKKTGYNYTTTYNCLLNEDGNIETIVWSDGDGNDEFSYSDGYLTQWVGWDIEDYVYQNGLMVSSGVAEEITYTDIPNVGNLFIGFTTDELYVQMFRDMGLLGNAPKYLPASATWNEGTETYEYELDSDGYVKTVKTHFQPAPYHGSATTTTSRYTYEDIR